MLTVHRTELSLTVPITNSLAFLFTVLGDWWADGKVISRGEFHCFERLWSLHVSQIHGSAWPLCWEALPYVCSPRRDMNNEAVNNTLPATHSRKHISAIPLLAQVHHHPTFTTYAGKWTPSTPTIPALRERVSTTRITSILVSTLPVFGRHQGGHETCPRR